MLVTAHTAGGHSALDVLIGLAILMWALAGAALLLGWLSRLAHKRRRRLGRVSQSDRVPRWLRARGSHSRATRESIGNTSRGSGPDPAPGASPPPRTSSARADRPTVPPPAIPGARLSAGAARAARTGSGQLPPPGRLRGAGGAGARHAAGRQVARRAPRAGRHATESRS